MFYVIDINSIAIQPTDLILSWSHAENKMWKIKSNSDMTLCKRLYDSMTTVWPTADSGWPELTLSDRLWLTPTQTNWSPTWLFYWASREHCLLGLALALAPAPALHHNTWAVPKAIFTYKNAVIAPLTINLLRALCGVCLSLLVLFVMTVLIRSPRWCKGYTGLWSFKVGDKRNSERG